MTVSNDNRGHHQTLHVLVNSQAGGAQANLQVIKDKVNQLANEGLKVHLHLLQGQKINRCLEDLADRESAVVAVGGGDGTVRHAVEVLAGTGHTLAILPVGTANLLARSLEIPLDIEQALELAITGKDSNIDAGMVNARLFFNVCSIGLYPELARHREERRQRHLQWPKFLRWLVDTTVSGIAVLRNWRKFRFKITIDGKAQQNKVITFAVANNAKLPVFENTKPDKGELVIYLPQPVSRWGFLVLMLQTIFLHPKDIEMLETQHVQKAKIEIPPETPMSLDGETVHIKGPLNFQSLKNYCVVRTP